MHSGYQAPTAIQASGGNKGLQSLSWLSYIVAKFLKLLVYDNATKKTLMKLSGGQGKQPLNRERPAQIGTVGNYDLSHTYWGK